MPRGPVLRSWLLGCLLAALTVSAYLPAFRGGFVWDDDDHVTQNETLRDLNGLRRIWVERGAVPQYYPLVHTSFWIEQRLWGLNPAGYHATNIVLHALAAILLWRVLLRLGLSGAFLAALIFALHPVAVESVAWITERKNVLAAVFYFASALCWLRGEPFAIDHTPAQRDPKGKKQKAPVESPADGRTGVVSKWYFISLFFFVCAMLSKTVACSLPAAMLLIIWWKTGRITRRDALVLAPFFAIGLALAANTALMERTRVGAVGSEWSFTFTERLLIAGRAVWFYAGKLFWPTNLTFIYPRWQIDAGSWSQWLFPVAATAVVCFLWLVRHRIGRGPLVAVLFFGGTLIPALGFVNVYPMRFSFVADHFQYFASVGLIALAAELLTRKTPVARAALVLPLALGVMTWRQSLVYRDLETLWTDTIRKNPSAWLAHNNLGNIHLERGDVSGAISRFRDAVQLKPDYYEALGNLGTALLRSGAIDEARTHTEAALRVSPRYTPALLNRAALLLRDGKPNESILVLQEILRSEPQNGEALNTLGSGFVLLGDVRNAQAAFEAALRIRPGLTDARVNLARLLIRTGRPEEASAQLDEVLRASPGNADARNARGMILVARGLTTEAIAYYRDLAQSLPTDASARFNLATLLSQTGRTNEAIDQFQAAIQLNPLHAEARNNLGITYIIANRYEEAAQQFREALRLRRSNPEAHNNLAYALIRLGRLDEAEASLREALTLRPGYEEARAQLRALGRLPR